MSERNQIASSDIQSYSRNDIAENVQNYFDDNNHDCNLNCDDTSSDGVFDSDSSDVGITPDSSTDSEFWSSDYSDCSDSDVDLESIDGSCNVNSEEAEVQKKKGPTVNTRENDGDDENNADENTNDEISVKIRTTEYTLRDMKMKESGKCGKRSGVWTMFQEIIGNDLNALKGKVACKLCLRVLNYKYQWGTSNLITHMKSCEKQNISSNGRITKDTLCQIKRKLNPHLVKFVTQDFRPCKTVGGEGFLNLADKFIEIGSQFGSSVKAKDIVSHPNTVGKKIHKLSEDHRVQLKKDLVEKLEKGLGITLDMWTEEHSKRPFLGVNVHYLADNYINERTLCIREINTDDQTGERIHQYVDQILREYGINDKEKLIFVSDHGGNIRKACEKGYWIRLNCGGHIVHNIVSHMLTYKPVHSYMKRTLKCCKQLVRYVKKSGLQTKLEKTLKAENKTRWNCK